jgi:hypothetical protein
LSFAQMSPPLTKTRASSTVVGRVQQHDSLCWSVRSARLQTASVV